jgi:hypothetical protein
MEDGSDGWMEFALVDIVRSRGRGSYEMLPSLIELGVVLSGQII